MNIRVLGAHNCETQDSKFATLLIDDVLAIDAGALTSSLSLQAQQKLKAILLTHLHYDHIRDIPAIAMNLYLNNSNINIYSIPPVYDALYTHLLNNELYPNFFERPQEKPTLKFTTIDLYKEVRIEGYSILAVPLNHSVPTVGYQVTSQEGKTVFYTGDTGPGMTECWKYVSPDLIIIEVTSINRWEEFARQVGHLTPSLLKKELTDFRELKGYLPQVVLVHMTPYLEEEIKTEIETIAESLNHPISLAYEGMQIRL